MLLIDARAAPKPRARSATSPPPRSTLAHRHPDRAVRARKRAFAELMIPIVKGWSTEGAQRNASLGVQVHGGMGYIEETGAAQYLRDARITTIYEGTTGIQANDLVGRKIGRDRGAALMAAIADLRETVPALAATGDARSLRHRHAPACRPRCAGGRRTVCRRVHAQRYARRSWPARFRSSSSAGIVFGGGQLARGASPPRRGLLRDRATPISSVRRSRPRVTSRIASSRGTRPARRPTVAARAAALAARRRAVLKRSHHEHANDIDRARIAAITLPSTGRRCSSGSSRKRARCRAWSATSSRAPRG